MFTAYLTQYHSREWEQLTAAGFLTAQVTNGMAIVVEADALITLKATGPPGCDICSPDNPAAWRYPVHAFESGVLPNHCSLDDFAVCQVCHELLQTGDRSALLDRAWELIGAGCDIPADHMLIVREQISLMQDGFFENRCGEPVALEAK
jgi:hypothetical protein